QPMALLAIEPRRDPDAGEALRGRPLHGLAPREARGRQLEWQERAMDDAGEALVLAAEDVEPGGRVGVANDIAAGDGAALLAHQVAAEGLPVALRLVRRRGRHRLASCDEQA